MHSRQSQLLFSRARTRRLSTKQHPTPSSSRIFQTPSTPKIPQPQSSTRTPSRNKPRDMSTTTNNNNTTLPFLLRFFDPSTASPDPRGRTLATILSWPDSNLERSHDYIQTVFPLPEGSMFQGAPLITPKIRKAFLSQPELRASLHGALERMLSFYGLQSAQDQIGEEGDEKAVMEVVRDPNFASNSRNWVTRFNHNHLRLTRILRSLRVLGLESDAAALHKFLSTDEDVTSRVSSRSQMYWRRAAERPLHLPPDEDDEGAEGIGWLREG